jgi:hypothetical protein
VGGSEIGDVDVEETGGVGDADGDVGDADGDVGVTVIVTVGAGIGDDE